jgi:hypothetical protein
MSFWGWIADRLKRNNKEIFQDFLFLVVDLGCIQKCLGLLKNYLTFVIDRAYMCSLCQIGISLH